jgi:hypothetical protein
VYVLFVGVLEILLAPHKTTHEIESFKSFKTKPEHYSNLPAPNLQPTANQERNDQYGNQHYSRELLMMGIVVPETC